MADGDFMAADDLTRPLGLAKPKTSGTFVRRLGIGVGSAAIVVAIGAVWFLLIQDPDTGNPGVASGPVNVPVDESIAAAPVVSPDDSDLVVAGPVNVPSANAVAAGNEAGLIEVVPDGGLSEIGFDAITITNPNDPAPMRLAAAPAEALAEVGAYGLLPRIGPDGAKPMDAYARPTEPQSSSNLSRIAIVVGGIGIAEAGTDAAIAELPGAVTLAFAPYGTDLPLTLARARATGHEILLQIPLEPYGYPNNDPGPHTLTVDASLDDNIDRLHWLMSRITNYAGIANYLGARFTSEDSAFAPVIAEIGERGLYYFDDGTSNTSRANGLDGSGTPFARADIVLDAVTKDQAIDARLDQIVAIAKKRGHAIATATAFPVSIARIAEFAKSAAERNIEIVPVSALVELDGR